MHPSIRLEANNGEGQRVQRNHRGRRDGDNREPDQCTEGETESDDADDGDQRARSWPRFQASREEKRPGQKDACHDQLENR